MADMSIPGVNSSLNTQKMVDDLMRVERIPLEKLKGQIEVYQNEKQNWVQVNGTLSKLQNSSTGLYGYTNPFSEKTTTSSNEAVVTAMADRKANKQEFMVTVKQIAGKDKLVSSNISESFYVEKGKYSFKVGNELLSVNFRGGTVEEFAQAVNARGKGILKASVIKSSSTNKVFILEAEKTGKEQFIQFEDQSFELFRSLKMIDKGTFSSKKDSRWIGETPLLPSNTKLVQNQSKEAAKGTLIVELEFQKETGSTVSSAKEADLNQPQGLRIPISGSITLEDVTIFNAPSLDSDASQKKEPDSIPNETEVPKNKVSLWIHTSLGKTEIDPSQIKIDAETNKVYAEISVENNAEINSLEIQNNDQKETLIIKRVDFVDSSLSRNYKPIHSLSLASDAILSYEGIDVTRPSNTIDDLVYGVSLNLKNQSPEEVKITIEGNREAVKDKIIEFVYNYNKVIETINVFTNSNPDVVNELSYLNDEEKRILTEKLGIFKGDTTLAQVKSKLQILVSSSYQATNGSTLNLLSQLGISTNSEDYAGYQSSKLRGYLEINSEQLDAAIEKFSSDEIKDLFGFDTDNDLVVDSGVAYEVQNFLSAYTKTGGILFYKINAYDRKVADTNKQIASMERSLEMKEAEYKRKYSQMEGMINEIQKNSQSLDGLNRKE